MAPKAARCACPGQPSQGLTMSKSDAVKAVLILLILGLAVFRQQFLPLGADGSDAGYSADCDCDGGGGD